jgi:CheY-like chemotaxis protein
MVERFTFDLTLTGIDMPLMALGASKGPGLRAERPGHPPMVVITKHPSEEGVLSEMEAEARAYIRKPFTVKDLSERGCFKGYSAGYFPERVPLTRGQHGFNFLDGPPGSNSPREVLHGFVNPATNDFAA